ncbi:MAG TPA: 16S rRNA (uracil(1498)-N(3))-methyltransferase, partial [Clostridiales bacterium]|nr:16S rRNA (uracil(1498)-N(3))-methyltransferase [Clostridiales bacterium]
EEEVAKAKKQKAKIVSLGKRILRCETAAIVAQTLVMYELGELSK